MMFHEEHCRLFLFDMINRWKLYDILGYKVYHKNVKRFHNSEAQTKVCCAPARTTKSYSASHDVLPDIFDSALRKDLDFRVWIVGPSYTLAEKEFRYLHEALVIKGRNLGIPRPKVCLTNPRSGQLYMHFQVKDDKTKEIIWNCYIEGKSADRPESLLGEQVDIAIYSEGSQLPRGIRERYVRPRLITKKGREIVPTTPDSRGEWVRELYDAGFSDEFPEIESFTWDKSANPKYDDEEFQKAKRFYGEDSPVFREQYLGEWVYFGGLVYTTFSEKTHVIKPFEIPRNWNRIRAIDFGHRDPFVCLWAAVGPYNELYFYREYYCREGRSIREHASYIRGFSKEEKITETVGDPSSKQAIEDISFEGIPCDSANNDRQAGRMRVLEYMLPTEDGPAPYPLREEPRAVGKKYPRYYIFDTCPEFIREHKFYRWKEGQSRENDKEKTEGDDHAMDTARYLCMTRPSPFKLKERVSPNSFAGWMSKLRRERLSRRSVHVA